MKRRVYLINLAFGLAGTERRIANVWRTLRRRGNVDPVLVIPDSLADILARADLIERDDDHVWTVPDSGTLRSLSRMRTGARLTDSFLAYARARKVARRYGPVWQRIQADPHAVIHVGLNCSSLNPPPGPIVYECMDSTLRLLGNRHYVNAAARPSIIHCQTERIRGALEATFADRDPQWTTVTSPMYFADYQAAASRESRDPMLVAFVGRFVPEKHPLLFVEAIARARAQGVPCRAVMLGEGPLLGDVSAAIARLGLDGLISTTFVPQPASVLSTASLYVSLQSGDNYGSQSLLEAMGAGCAVIASDVGETRRLVTDEVGIRVGFDVADVAGAIATLLTSPARRTAAGQRAAHIARTEYTAHRYTAFIESLYDLAVEKYKSCRDAASIHTSYPKTTLG